MSTRRWNGRDGFTLVEALTAFVILGMLTLVVQRGIVMARMGILAAESRVEAERIAFTLLDEPVSRTILRGGGRSGVTDGRRWTVTAEPLNLPIPKPVAESETPPAPPVAPSPNRPAQGGEASRTSADGSDDASAKGPDPAAWRAFRVTIRVETSAGRTLAVETARLAQVGGE